MTAAVCHMQENNRTELERLEKERNSDFLSMLKGFVVNQACLSSVMFIVL